MKVQKAKNECTYSDDNQLLKWIKYMKYGKILGCHQKPERSFFYKGYQFPVCARCTGVVISSIISVVFSFFCDFPIYLSILMSLVMFFDWLIQFLKIKQSTNKRRFITGMIGGFGWTNIHLFIYYQIYQLAKMALS